MTNMLGTETTNKILGEPPKEEPKISLPDIPEVQTSSTSTEVYDKSGTIHSQGESFNKLSPDKKRPYIVAYLKEVYQVTRNAEAKNEDLTKYVNVIEQGGSREGVYRAITNDQVYAALESYQDSIGDKLVDFVLDYAAKYLRVSYNKEGMKKSNLYIVKRIIVEKTLDVLDAMAKNPDDVYRWYAVFSTELASKYAGLLVTKIRTSTDEMFHYEWAKKVPWQHIKSEVIIKLHTVMNGL